MTKISKNFKFFKFFLILTANDEEKEMLKIIDTLMARQINNDLE